MSEDKETQGLTVTREQDFSEWYTQVVAKSEMADYTSVSGCIVFRPYSYEMWEKIQDFVNQSIKKTGHKNCYFPMLIPESLLTKEQEHVEGFTPEVAWVTHAGESKLNERLAVRPTSETIMYDSYKKWIRSWRDLPLLLNQWNSVVRWEFKHAKPFLRTREFLWHEGHTAHATQKEADEEVLQILADFKTLVQDHMAIAVVDGRKSEAEKFAGADYTTTIESVMPDGKALQMGTSHMLGQNFSKAFDISFTDENEKKAYVWQTSWAVSSRLLGALIMAHGDDKGLVVPPKMAPIQVKIIPIIFKDSKDKIFAQCEKVKKALEEAGISVDADLSEGYSAGWKFNEAELKGIPLRVEIGPKDVEKDQVVMVKRNDGKKEFVPTADVASKARELLDTIQSELFEASKAHLEASIVDVSSMDELKKAIENKKLARAHFCGKKEEEDKIQEATGAVSRCFAFADQKGVKGKCVISGEDTEGVAIFGKCY